MVASVVLIAGFFVVELVVGIISNSLALIADAGHMATDVVALLMGMTALLMARHGSTTARRSFGWHRAEVFSAIVNAVLLIAVGAYVLYEAVERIDSQYRTPAMKAKMAERIVRTASDGITEPSELLSAAVAEGRDPAA